MRSLSITALCTAFLLLVAHDRSYGQGQQGSGSPYSAYGFGDLFNSTQVSQALMGVTGVGLADPYSVAYANPASYVGLSRPVFETGGVGRFLGYKTASVDRRGQRTDLLGLSLGVPFAQGKWGFALGVHPVSDVGYKISDAQTLPNGSPVTFQYSGNGGLNRAFLGLGHTVWQSNDTLDRGTKLTVGANLNYLFGSMEELRKVYYPASGGYYNTSTASTLTVRSPMANVGIQLAGDLRSREQVKARMQARRDRQVAQDKREEQDWINAGKDPKDRKPVRLLDVRPEALRYRIGIASELPTSLKAKHTGVVNTFIMGSTGVEFPVDTAWFQEGAQGHVQLPASYSIGATAHNKHWTLTAEYRIRDWSGLRVDVDGFAQRSQLATQAVHALGATYRPAGDGSGSTFLNRNIYRGGLRYTSDYLMVGGTQLNEAAVSAGLSIPLMALQTRSRLNLGVELGQRGDVADGLLRERFTNIYVGVTITPEGWDQWFRKRRID